MRFGLVDIDDELCSRIDANIYLLGCGHWIPAFAGMTDALRWFLGRFGLKMGVFGHQIGLWPSKYRRKQLLKKERVSKPQG